MKYEQKAITDEELRKLQLTLLEMLIETDRICNKYDIKYSLDGGTLLGAVRHKGFIPWDDDIDVIMLRSEYEKFYNACEKELDKSRFFLQEYRTDKYYRFGYEKIRRKNSVFRRTGQEHLKQHEGMFIDIFVADNVPDNFIIRNLHLFMCFIIRKGLYSEIGKKNVSNSFLLKAVYRVLSAIPRDFWFGVRNAIAGRCNRKRTELVRHMTHNYQKSRYGMPRICFDEFADIEFEGRIFKGFKNYDLYLSRLYGDYMQLPPEEERKSHLSVSEIKFPD